jgi:hypothetical protein
VVPHVCGSENPDCAVVRKLGFVDIGTVSRNISTIVDGICFGIQEPNAFQPVPRLLSPVEIGRVASITGETCSDIEETAIGNTCRCTSQPPL